MNPFLKSMILPLAATVLLSGTAANAQIPAPKSVMSANKDSAQMSASDNSVPLVLVDSDDDDDDGDHYKRGKKKRIFGSHDDDEDEGDDDDDDDDEDGANANRQQMDGPAPDNGLFKKGTKPTVEVQ